MYQPMLITAITYEAGKRDTIAAARNGITNLNRYIEEVCDRWDARHPERITCDGTIMCQRVQYRHKRDCLGKLDTMNGLLRNVQ